MSESSEIETLTGTVGEVADALKARAQAPGTYLSVLVVEAQTELAPLSDFEVTKRLADLVVHVALRRGPAMTPRRLLAELLAGYPITDESWAEKVAPELRRVLAKAGHAFRTPEPPPVSVSCEKCGNETTGDYTWDWPDRRMVVCSACASLGRPDAAPAKKT